MKYHLKNEADILAQMLCEADGISAIYTLNLGADFFNYKAEVGPCPIYCILADSREWRFYRVDFEEQPFKVERVAGHIYLSGTEGAIDFLVGLKKGTLSRKISYL
jgi:hypothetical protein